MLLLSDNDKEYVRMRLDEFPLLNKPNVMLVALKITAGGPARPEDCLKQLEASLRQARLALPSDTEPLLRRIEISYRCLRVARLVERDDEGRYTITHRGRTTLDAHPTGIDTSVLMKFPEFRAFIRRSRTERDSTEIREPAKGYNEGYIAGLVGGSITDNPYSVDNFAHLEWENGWCEARDEKTDVVQADRPWSTESGKDDISGC